MLTNKIGHAGFYVRDLHRTLGPRNHADITNLVFANNLHAGTGHPQRIWICGYLDGKALNLIDHGGWPSVGLVFSPEINSITHLGPSLETARNGRVVPTPETKLEGHSLLE